MGLFSSKKKVTVQTTVTRVIENHLLPNSLRVGLIRGIFADEGEQIIPHMMEELAASIGVRAERMYQYGKRDYPYGVPTSKVHSSRTLDSVLKVILQGLEGTTITFEYSHFGFLNHLHYGWTELIANYGYNPVTNELAVLSTAKGFPVYLDDLQVMVTQATADEVNPDALDQYGSAAQAGYTPLRPMQSRAMARTHTPYGVDALATEDYFKLSIIWKDAAAQVNTELLTFPMVDPDSTLEFFQAEYSFLVPSGTGQMVISPITGLEEYVEDPPIKHYKYFTYQENEGTWPELDVLFSTEYDALGSFFPFGYLRFNKQSSAENPNSVEYKSQKKLMKYLGMDFVQIADAINANPEIADVDSALLMMAVPAKTSNAMERRYLFDFFKALALKKGTLGVGAATYTSEDDALVSQGLHMTSSADRINLTIRDSRFTTALSMSGIYRRTRAGSIGAVGSYSSSDSGADYTYRHQISATLYEEIKVRNLQMVYLVSGKYATTTTMVPIDHTISEKYSAPKRETLFSRSLHYIINTRQVTETHWYQQSWFKIVMIIVAIVITIVSWGADGGSTLAAAIAAGTVTLEMLVVAAIVAAIEYLVINLVVKLFVKLLGPEFAMLVAIVAVVYVGYSSYNAGSVANAPWAQELLSVSTGIMKESSEYYTKAIEGLKEEAELFSAYSKKEMEQLKLTSDLLEGDNLMSPFVIFGESPRDYYNRTVHSGNIGVLGIEAISRYVDISLTLPTLSQTLGEDYS